MLFRSAQKNTILLATWLQEQKDVVRVIFPGFSEHKGYKVLQQQARGCGAMITFEVSSVEIVKHILNQIKLIQYAESLGGVETLITYPITQTHADVPKEILKRNGITDRVLRLSVGIENVEDMINDLQQAFI